MLPIEAAIPGISRFSLGSILKLELFHFDVYVNTEAGASISSNAYFCQRRPRYELDNSDSATIVIVGMYHICYLILPHIFSTCDNVCLVRIKSAMSDPEMRSR